MNIILHNYYFYYSISLW